MTDDREMDDPRGPGEDYDKEQALERVFDMMARSARRDFKKTWLPILYRLHPGAWVLRLYRSALVVLPQTDEEDERGAASIRIYHDPGWMGEETNDETLARHSALLRFFGQRNFVDMYYEPAECGDGGVWSHETPHDEVCQICRGTGKGNWRIPDPSRPREDPPVEVEDLPEEAFVYWCKFCWGSGVSKYRPDWDQGEAIAQALADAQLTWQELQALDQQRFDEALKQRPKPKCLYHDACILDKGHKGDHEVDPKTQYPNA